MPPSKRKRDPEPGEREFDGMVHFVVHAHATKEFDVVPLARLIFGTNNCLVAKHVNEANHHWHFHGKTVYASMQAVKDNIRAECKSRHPAYEDNKNARPWITSQKKKDEWGYPYVCHEGADRVVYSQGFTQDEINEFAAKSTAYCAEKKDGLMNHLRRKFITRPPMMPEELHQKLAYEAFDYLRQEKVPHIVRANIAAQVFTFFHQAEWLDDYDRDYLSFFYMRV